MNKLRLLRTIRGTLSTIGLWFVLIFLLFTITGTFNLFTFVTSIIVAVILTMILQGDIDKLEKKDD